MENFAGNRPKMFMCRLVSETKYFAITKRFIIWMTRKYPLIHVVYTVEKFLVHNSNTN